MKKRLFAAFICLIMVLALLPATSLAADEHKTYTFTSSDTYSWDGKTGISAYVFYKGDTIVFTPDKKEPFSSNEHGACHSVNVGLSFCDISTNGDVTGGICSVNEYSIDGSGCMASFTITSDNPVMMRFKGAGPTGVESPSAPRKSGENFYSYRYHHMMFTTYPQSYLIEYDLGEYGVWPDGVKLRTELVINSGSDTATLLLPNPESNDSRYQFVDWYAGENARLITLPEYSSIPVNGLSKITIKTVPMYSETPPAEQEHIIIRANWINWDRVAAPTFSLGGGHYDTAQSVLLSSDTPDATIFYTTDGSLPTSGSTVRKMYTEPLEIADTTTITAIAYSPYSNMYASEVVSATYTIGDAPTELPVLEGAKTKWKAGSTDGLTFRVDGDLDKFQGISVDGNNVNGDKYIVQAGSTIVMLKTDYLQTLSSGGHTLYVNFADGYAEADFSVKTGGIDSGSLGSTILWVALLLVGLAGVVIAIVFIRKKKRSTAE